MTIFIPYVQNIAIDKEPVLDREQFIARVIMVELACQYPNEAPFWQEIYYSLHAGTILTNLSFFRSISHYKPEVFISQIIVNILTGKDVFIEKKKTEELAIYYLDGVKRWIQR